MQTEIVESITNMIEIYIPLIFCGVIIAITASFFVQYKYKNFANDHQKTNDIKSISIISSSSSSTSTCPSDMHHRIKVTEFETPKLSTPTSSNSNLNINPNSSESSKLIINTNSIHPNPNLISPRRRNDPLGRYDIDGSRFQCCSIPFRINRFNEVEVLMISSRKSGDHIFPGGGWEKHETKTECAARENWEEAGIKGECIKEIITEQKYVSDKGNRSKMWGYLFKVTEILDEWPESERTRKWMDIDEVDRSLIPKRRKKFGALWKNAKVYFNELNLFKYHKKKEENVRYPQFEEIKYQEPFK